MAGRSTLCLWGKKPKGFCDHGWGLWLGQSQLLEQQEEAERARHLNPAKGIGRHTLLPSAPRTAAGPPVETRFSAKGLDLLAGHTGSQSVVGDSTNSQEGRFTALGKS
ncbi:hypothetical protein PAL_GLEAN10013191 [Pteropus alecto]|uniref:Uncharacterized protein n=1 Tax=Pteropus alecto TaxID=9402 RepID=L5KE60_PTEAL|nr:hypothetical protein PAL_GLEAN10013191 [Pteropus alecto]